MTHPIEATPERLSGGFIVHKIIPSGVGIDNLPYGAQPGESMSFHFYLYRAAAGLPPINAWEAMHAEPLGNPEQVKGKLDALFDDLRWDAVEGGWNGVASTPGAAYVDVWLNPERDGTLRFLVMNKARPSTMRKVCEAFGFNYVAAPEAGDLVDIHAYDDDDQHYAKLHT
jgi:hypothetical protein